MILVTGGAGFIGSHVVDKLIDQGYKVLVIDNLTTGNLKNLNPKAKFLKHDIREALDIKDVEAIIHHAAQINVRHSVEKPRYDADVNVLGTINLLELARKADAKFIYASSMAVYGNPKYLPVDENHEIDPISPYGLSKYCGELYIKLYNNLYGLEYSILRYSNVYGERQNPKGEAGVISIFISKILSGERPVIFGNGEQTRDFVYVGDVAKANVMALNWKNEVVNIGTGTEITINKLYKIIKEKMNYNEEPIYDKPRKGDVYRVYLDITRAKKLGWEPEVSLNEGLDRVISWMRKCGQGN
ncbi:SDR family oxidoreductase [Methanocaldococcus infernus]